MKLNEYQELAQRTSGNKRPSDAVVNGVLGLCGETGECADIVKKYMYQGAPLDKEHFAEELGDVLWYVAETITGLQSTMADVIFMGLDNDIDCVDVSCEKSSDDLLTPCLRMCHIAGMFGGALVNYFDGDNELPIPAMKNCLIQLYAYISDAARAVGKSMDQIATANIDKLRKRYPDGFSAERSNNLEA